MPVEETGEAAGLVWPDRDLFDHADTATVTHFRDDEVLQVDGSEVGRLEIVESY